MEHRAAVLSFSVRDMEKKISPSATSYDFGYDSNRSTISTPARTSITGLSEPKFEGAHFFAGHSDAIIPKKRLSPEATAAEIANLETKLKAATESLAAAGKQRLELARELSLARLEKQEVEAMRDLDLQAAQETILALEEELPRLENLDLERQSLLLEKEEWVRERSRLEEQSRQVEILRNQITDLETKSGEAATERLLVEIREEYQGQLEGKEREIDELRRQWELGQEEWKRERAEWEDDRENSLQRLQEMERLGGQDEDVLQHISQELDDGLVTLRQMIREHGIALVSREPSLKDLLEALRSHLQAVHSNIEEYKLSEVDRSATIRKLEDDMRAELSKREALTRELESTKKDRNFAKTEARNLQVIVMKFQMHHLSLPYYRINALLLSSLSRIPCPRSTSAQAQTSTNSSTFSSLSGVSFPPLKLALRNLEPLALGYIAQAHPSTVPSLRPVLSPSWMLDRSRYYIMAPVHLLPPLPWCQIRLVSKHLRSGCKHLLQTTER